MDFAPADYLLGLEQPITATNLTDHPKLPDGTYKFVELFCTDRLCDCRKTIFQIFHNGKSVGSIDYGWESRKFYTKWARGDKTMALEMQGWSPNPLCDFTLNPDDLTDLMQELMNEKWLANLKDTYQQVRNELKVQNSKNAPLSTQKAPSRNSPCPCGSGKKYKRCCIDKPLKEAAQNITPFPGSSSDLIETTPQVEEEVEQALAHLRKSQFNKAKQILFPLLEEHPRQASIPYAIGIYYARQKEFQDSVIYFEDATDLDPEFSEAWHNLGVSYRSTANIAGAIQCAQEVMKHGDPNEAYVIETQKFLDKTAKTIRKNTGLSLDDYIINNLTYDTSFLLMQEGLLESAIEGFENVLKLEPTNYQSHGNLALCHAMLGDKETALRHLEQSLEINPDYEVAQSNKPAIENLADGEKLELPMQTVNYGLSGLKPI